MRISSRAWLPLLIVLLPACSHALQQSSVSRSFQSRFACASTRVTRVGDGYHVEGCGRSAEYACFAAAPYYYGHHHHHTSVGGAFVEGLVSGLVSGSRERCVLTYSERSSPAPIASSAPSAVRHKRAHSGEVFLQSRALFAGGHLVLRANPGAHREHALLTLHSVTRLPAAPCQVGLFADGLPVPVREQARAGAYDVHLAVPIAALAQAEESLRFAGSGCGVSFELDASARATLTTFAAHFLEQRARLAQTIADAPAGVQSSGDSSGK